MQVYGQLIAAQVENLAADPTGSGLVEGRIWRRTDTNEYKMYSGGVVRSLVDLSLTQTLSNKTLDAPVVTNGIDVNSGDLDIVLGNLNIDAGSLFIDAGNLTLTAGNLLAGDAYQEWGEIATPATPAAGKHRLYFKSDDQLYSLDDQGIERQVGSGGGGAAGIVTGDDSNLNFTAGDWVAYADAADPDITDATGGSPTLTVARNTSGPLHESGDLLLTKDAADRQGEGGSILLDVDPKFRGRPVLLNFVYAASANFGYGSGTFGDPSDITVQVYDVTNAQAIDLDNRFLFGDGYFQGKVQLATNVTQVRVALHVATTNASAWTFQADDFDIDLALNQTSNAISDWVDGGVLDIDATTTAPTKPSGIAVDQVWYRIVGSDLEVRFEYRQTNTTGANNGSGDYLIKMPAGYKIDTSKVTVYSTVEGQGFWNTNNAVGNAAGGLNGSQFLGAISVYDEDSVRVYGSNNDGGGVSNGYWSSAAYFGLAASATIQMTGTFRVPLANFTSGYEHPAQVGLNAKVLMRAYKNGGAITANTTIASWTGVNKDTTGGFNPTTGVYTVTSPGDYFVSVIMQNTAQTSDAVRILLNGVSYALGVGDGNSSLDSTNTVMTDLKYGDEITVEHTGSVTLVSTDNSSLSIYKIGSQNQPYAPRVAYIKDEKPTNTAGGTFTAGAWQTRDLNTLTGDQSFVSLSSNQFVLQPGTYDIDAIAPASSSADTQLAQHKIKLRDVTNAVDIIIGQNSSVQMQTGTANAATTHSSLMGRFVVTAPTTFEIQHRCGTTRATVGFGLPHNFGVNEVYTQVRLTKVL